MKRQKIVRQFAQSMKTVNENDFIH